MLLPPAEHVETNEAKLAEHIGERLVEGHGEAMFDLGFEDNGDSMRLNRDEWDAALTRLTAAAKKHNADCNVLLTKYVGGNTEAESATGVGDNKDKIKDCTGKILIRKARSTVESVIETRIAVVGNGESSSVTFGRM